MIKLRQHEKPITDKKILEILMRKNNPYGERVGDYTGRCKKCGSKNLWDDNLSYGCRDCGYIRLG